MYPFSLSFLFTHSLPPSHSLAFAHSLLLIHSLSFTLLTRYAKRLTEEARCLASDVTAALGRDRVHRAPTELELVCERVLDGLVEGIVNVDDPVAAVEFLAGCATCNGGSGDSTLSHCAVSALRRVSEAVRALRDVVTPSGASVQPATPPKAAAAASGFPFKTPGKRKPTAATTKTPAPHGTGAASQRKTAFGRKGKTPATAPMVVVAQLHFDSPDRASSSSAADGVAADDSDTAATAAAARLRVERHPVCLVLDKQAQSVPFESMPSLRHHAVCRVPSASLLSSREQGESCIIIVVA
jgi:hypothetical protein